MKQESGFNKTDHVIVSGQTQRQDGIGQTMTPDCLSPEVSDNAPDVCKVTESDTGGPADARQAKRSKVKVIPMRQEDVDAGQVSSGRNRMMIGFVIVLSVVLGFIIMRSMGFGRGQQAKSSETDGSDVKKVTAVTKAQVVWNVPGLIKSARDITMPAEVAELPDTGELADTPKLPDILVSGIIVYSNNNISAIIDGGLVIAGDVVDGVKVYKITEDSVEFEKDGVRWVRQVK
jgi:hypothetical protein